MKDFFKENRNIFVISLAVIILLIFLHSLKVITPLENVLVSALKPIQSGFVSLTHSVNNTFSKFAKINELQEENDTLRKQLDQLIIENNYIKTLLEENKIIEPQIQFLQEKNYEFVFARVISKGVDPTFKILTINRGKNDGLQKGMPVIVENGYLIGKLIGVEDNRSHVMLLNDTRSTTASQVQNDKGTEGLITGEFGLSLKMGFIPKDDKIEVGQSVITSGLENSIPKGLVIGLIDDIKIKTGDFFQTAYINPLVDYEKVQVLSIITNF